LRIANAEFRIEKPPPFLNSEFAIRYSLFALLVATLGMTKLLHSLSHPVAANSGSGGSE
jgi:hypothetical protein